jgi:hypothetical protein
MEPTTDIHEPGKILKAILTDALGLSKQVGPGWKRSALRRLHRD